MYITALKTFNVKLKFASDADKTAFVKTLEFERRAFNAASEVNFRGFHKRRNSLVMLHGKFYRKFRDANPDVPAVYVNIAEREVIARFAAIYKNKHQIEVAPAKKALSMELDGRIAKLDFANQNIRLSCANKNQRVTATFQLYPAIPKNLELSGPAVFVKNGEVYLSLRFITPEPKLVNNKVIGVDLGVNRVAATSCGKIFKAENYNASKRQLRYLKRRLQAKNTKTAKRHLKKARRKERNKSRDFVHHISNALLNLGAGTLVLEDLTKLKESSAKKNRKKIGVKNATRINNKVSQVPFYALKKTLEYKAQARGQRVVTVNPAYTSQIDSRTGKREGLRVGCRFYCVDRVILDADVNAANNILSRYTQLPLSPRFQLLEGQADVIRPYAARNSFSRKKLRAASPRSSAGGW